LNFVKSIGNNVASLVMKIGHLLIDVESLGGWYARTNAHALNWHLHITSENENREGKKGDAAGPLTV